MDKDWSDFIRKKVKQYDINTVKFTKVKLLDWLEKRNKSSIKDLKRELISCRDLVFTEKQNIEFQGTKETRYRCYFVYSGSKGRCYVINFNSLMKIITVFPLGRSTLRRYKKRFK